MNTEDEVWMPVPSRPGLMASSWGRVVLPVREYKMPNGGVARTRPAPTYGTRTRASKTARHQYMGLVSRYFGNIKVHRMVCEAFHGPAPFAGAVVIHLDEDAANNLPGNLRWGTQKENLNMPGFIAYCRARTGENSPAVKGRKMKGQHGTP